jgi:rubrerythrin
MAIVYTADEVLQLAEQIERNGARFYRHAAGLPFDEQTRHTLLDLATWEDRHEETFAAMRTQLGEEARAPTTFDPHHELPLYLRALADRRVFEVNADPVERLTGQETMWEILELALGFEKDSVVFYLGMRDLVPAEVGGVHIDGIIKEEMSHISLLGSRLAEVAG